MVAAACLATAADAEAKCPVAEDLRHGIAIQYLSGELNIFSYAEGGEGIVLDYLFDGVLGATLLLFGTYFVEDRMPVGERDHLYRQFRSTKPIQMNAGPPRPGSAWSGELKTKFVREDGQRTDEGTIFFSTSWGMAGTTRIDECVYESIPGKISLSWPYGHTDDWALSYLPELGFSFRHVIAASDQPTIFLHPASIKSLKP